MTSLREIGKESKEFLKQEETVMALGKLGIAGASGFLIYTLWDPEAKFAGVLPNVYGLFAGLIIGIDAFGSGLTYLAKAVEKRLKARERL